MGETMDFYKETNKELKKNDELLQCIHDWAVELGMDPYHINSTNIKQKLDKVIRTHLTLESKAKELGYSSLSIALKDLERMTNKG